MGTVLWSGGHTVAWLTAASFSGLPGTEGKNRLLGINSGLKQDGWEGWVPLLSVMKATKAASAVNVCL